MVSYALKAAEKRGEVVPGDTIVEASSGNTGVAMSMVAAVKNYKTIIVVPDTISQLKINMMKAYGAQIQYTPAKDGVNAAVHKAREIADEHNAFLLNQFRNPDNIKAHHATGREILSQARHVDVFVAGIGTGGTLIGVAEVLKKASSETKIIAVEPYTSPAFFNMFYRKSLPIDDGIPHNIEGIGESFVPEILRMKHDLVDGVILVTDRDAFNTRNRLAIKEGLFVGISSGANVDVALRLAKNVKLGETIVTVLPDNGLRYFR
jgi:cysteine synthase A